MTHSARFSAMSILCALVLCFLGSASFAGTLTGTVQNGTTGQPVAGVTVALLQLQGGMQTAATTKTDPKGHFQFNHPDVGVAPMLLRAKYRGVNYHEPVPPGKGTANIEVFEPTKDLAAFSVTSHALIFQPRGNDLLVGEEYIIENKTKPPVAFYREDGSFLFSIPEGAQFNQASAWGSSGMPVTQGTIDKGKNQMAIAFPFRPGESGIRISYTLPYSGNHAAVRSVSPYNIQQIFVGAPPSVQISGEGLSPAGQNQGFNVYTRGGVSPNSAFNVSVSGTAPMVSSAQGGGSAGPPQGDDGSQNSSVNSRADSAAAEAPTASATTLPARLDSLKWILVGGFAAIFALGFVYLLRQPQFAGAGSGSSTAAETGESAPAKRAPKAKPAASTAEVEREVRGSLDDLKDKIFRLELRREAGTIGEEDYARERERLQKVLRDLVRG
ncbi:MAG TPA: carboxypeptidase-like regulatory domain-containing protein [Candidatus Limnocylindrales bacterium]|nr:carboxypeptidase-like regulatory domain-containing protein [Candidatus Limnocylindrales bacterium]